MKLRIYSKLHRWRKTTMLLISLATLVSCVILFLFTTEQRALRFVSRNTSHAAVPAPSKTKLITTTGCPSHLKVIILILSNTDNLERRNAIRRTWGVDYSVPARWKTMYLLGMPSHEARWNLEVESRQFHDLIIGNYTENFRNIIFKVAMGFEWALKYCVTFDYLLKTDDDVFVNPFRLTSFLCKSASRTRLYMGNKMKGSPVLRKGRYAVPVKVLNQTFFDPYCSGGGILLSADVTKTFMDLFDVNTLLTLDDVYLGVLAKKAGIRTIGNENIRMYEDSCTFRPRTLVQHPARGACLTKLFKNLTKILYPEIL